MDRRTFIISSASFLTFGAAACGSKADPASSVTSSTVKGSSTTSTSNSTLLNNGGSAKYIKEGTKTDSVAFTFHTDGPINLVNAMLSKLATLQVPITSFVVGQWAEQNPGMVRTILAGGHELGNHTYSHRSDLGTASEAVVASEITKCRDVLISQVGTPGKWFRPSATDVPTQLELDEAGKAGYQASIGYSVDPVDYRDPGAAAVISRVDAAIKGGSIVSLHMGHQGTIDAIGDLVGLAQRRNLKLVTVSNLI